VPKARRLPLPWSVEELQACFVVRDHNGTSGNSPTSKATIIAKLPELLR